MSNFTAKSLQNSQINPFHLIQSHPKEHVELHTDNSFITMSGNQAVNIRSLETVTEINAQTAINPALLSQASAVVDFVLDPGMVEVQHIRIKEVLNNASGGNVSQIPMLTLTQIEFRDSGSKVYYRCTGQDLYENLIFEKQESMKGREQVTNIDSSTYGVFSTQADGTSREYYVDLPNVMRGLVPSALNEEVRIRLTFAGAQGLSAGTFTGCTVTDLKLQVYGSELSEDEYEARRMQYKNGTIHHRFLDQVVYSSSVTNPSGKQSFLLDSHAGLSPYGFISVRPAGGAQIAAYTDAIAEIDLKDSNGRQVFPAKSEPQLRYVEGSDFFESNFSSTIPVLPLVHCKSPKLAYHHGQNTGGHPYDSSGRDKIDITYKTVAPGSYTVRVASAFYRFMVIHKGRLEVIN